MFCSNADEIYICGGGSENNFLIERLSQMNNITIKKTDELNLPHNLLSLLHLHGWQVKHWLGKKITLLKLLDLKDLESLV